MNSFNLSEFSKRLKEIAKTEFGGIGKLGEQANIPNILLYTQKNAREPKATVLFKLASTGVDVNYLLTGEKKLTEKDMNEEINRLKAKIFDMMEYMEEMKRTYNKEDN